VVIGSPNAEEEVVAGAATEVAVVAAVDAAEVDKNENCVDDAGAAAPVPKPAEKSEGTDAFDAEEAAGVGAAAMIADVTAGVTAGVDRKEKPGTDAGAGADTAADATVAAATVVAAGLERSN
jgi:hypothetical protein